MYVNGNVVREGGSFSQVINLNVCIDIGGLDISAIINLLPW